MIVSDQHRFVFIHIPKCAGTSLRRLLEVYDESGGAFRERVDRHPDFGLLDYTHLPLHVLAEVAPEVYGKLRSYAGYAIARDPFQRFPSAIAQRLKMYGGQELAQTDAAALRAEIDATIAYLGAREHVIAPDYIHFARQVDFVEHAGERLVREVFPVEGLNAFLAAVGARIGTSLGQVGHENQAAVLRFSSLRGLVVFGSAAAKLMLPAELSQRLRTKARQILTQPARGQLPAIFRSGSVTDFVADYYAADIALHQAAMEQVGISGESKIRAHA